MIFYSIDTIYSSSFFSNHQDATIIQENCYNVLYENILSSPFCTHSILLLWINRSSRIIKNRVCTAYKAYYPILSSWSHFIMWRNRILFFPRLPSKDIDEVIEYHTIPIHSWILFCSSTNSTQWWYYIFYSLTSLNFLDWDTIWILHCWESTQQQMFMRDIS